jgi:hypothetical protein
MTRSKQTRELDRLREANAKTFRSIKGNEELEKAFASLIGHWQVAPYKYNIPIAKVDLGIAGLGARYILVATGVDENGRSVGFAKSAALWGIDWTPLNTLVEATFGKVGI